LARKVRSSLTVTDDSHPDMVSLAAMLSYRVVIVEDDDARTTTILTMALERSPDVGSTIELPHGEPVLVRHVYSGHDDHGVIIAGPASR
jgi:hypothetical protein